MTAPPTREHELQALRRPFAIGVACIVLAVVALGVVIARFGSNADRPAGIAERWLVAVGDTTRDGVEDDAAQRVEENGITLDEALLTFPGLVSAQAGEDGERAFESVRVGRVSGTDLDARVPFELTPYEGDDLRGLAYLADDGSGWAVTGITPADGATDCDGPCGFPIERPERAPIGWFAGALALGVLITLGCIAAVRAATPKSA